MLIEITRFVNYIIQKQLIAIQNLALISQLIEWC